MNASKRFSLIQAGAMVMAIAACRSIAAAEEIKLDRFEFTEQHMAVDFRIVLYAADSEAANRASRAAFERIEQLNRTLSDYRADSELSILSATAASEKRVHVSDDVWNVLATGERISRATHGAFDATVGPLVKLWRRARRQNALPDAKDLAAARAAVGWQHLRLDPARRTVELLKPKMRLDVGGIAKGYAADEALKVLRKHGVTSALVGAAGDMAIGDPPPGTLGWIVGIAPLDVRNELPSRHLLLANAGVATSGDAFQFVVIDGKRYSHIVDPRTGLGLTLRSSVTIVAPNGMLADGTATATSVLGPVEGMKLIERNFLETKPPLAACFVSEPNAEPAASKKTDMNETNDTRDMPIVAVSSRMVDYELSVPRLAERLGNREVAVDERMKIVRTLARVPQQLKSVARKVLEQQLVRETNGDVRAAIAVALK